MKNNLEKFVSKLFTKNEIKEISIADYKYDVKNKISVLVPQKFLEKLATEMSNAGAGKIGNYDLCSFRLNGTGTFKPSSKAKPFTGNKNKLNFVEEVKLEMHTAPEHTDKVINAVYKFHPYEEPVYEITEIKFRTKLPETISVKLKKNITAENLFTRLNKKLVSFPLKKNISTVLFTDNPKVNAKADAVIFTGEPIKVKLK